LAAFNFDLVNDNVGVLNPPSFSPCAATDCNPDFNQAEVTGLGWACSPPAPSADVDEDADPNTTQRLHRRPDDRAERLDHGRHGAL
jgi:hypothetical protein